MIVILKNFLSCLRVRTNFMNALIISSICFIGFAAAPYNNHFTPIIMSPLRVEKRNDIIIVILKNYFVIPKGSDNFMNALNYFIHLLYWICGQLHTIIISLL
jgi:hypothetical protein